MTADKLTELRRLAEQFQTALRKFEDNDIDFEDFEVEVCRYEQAFCPATVLQLLDEIEQTNNYVESLVRYKCELESENVRQKAEIVRLKCCGNCEHWERAYDLHFESDKCDITGENSEVDGKCDKWESV